MADCRVIDDHSRIAYAEIWTDEKAATAVGVLQRATAWFAGHGVTVERVLSDNGPAYGLHAWRKACAERAYQAQAHTPPPATDQRQVRFQPHPGRRVGLLPVRSINPAAQRHPA